MKVRAITAPLLVCAVASAGAVAQAATAPSHSYTVKLSGSAETPKGAPKGAGTATITIKGAAKQLCWKFSVTGVTAPNAAHIHVGPPGTAGNVVIPLGGKYRTTGCVKVAPALLTKIVASPKSYYVNIHNAKYPGGAVRAQL